jgi:hypothetical protein
VSCEHKSTVEVRLLITDELVAKICTDCEIDLPASFKYLPPSMRGGGGGSSSSNNSVFGGIVTYWMEEGGPVE